MNTDMMEATGFCKHKNYYECCCIVCIDCKKGGDDIGYCKVYEIVNRKKKERIMGNPYYCSDCILQFQFFKKIKNIEQRY
jgi:hypothetical protein